MTVDEMSNTGKQLGLTSSYSQYPITFVWRPREHIDYDVTSVYIISAFFLQLLL